jgi:hypothetical protein
VAPAELGLRVTPSRIIQCLDIDDQLALPRRRTRSSDALSRPTLGFPADVMRDASVVSGIYGAHLADIDDPRARAVRRTTTGA